MFYYLITAFLWLLIKISFLIKILIYIVTPVLLGYCVYKFSIIHYNREWTWYVEKYWYWYVIFFEAIIMLFAIIFDLIAIFAHKNDFFLIFYWTGWSLKFLNILFFAIMIYYIQNLIVKWNALSSQQTIDILSYIVGSFVVTFLLFVWNFCFPARNV